MVFSGDFKVDYTPIDGQVTDLAGFAELGSKGVLAFLCESTNIERKGYTMSETKIGQTFIDMFQQAKGRVIVAMFASNIHRVQMVVDSAAMFGRRVCFVGRSMVNVTRVAMSIGELSIPEENLIDVDDLENYADEEILVVTTGSQGEAMAGLTRMAYGEHRKLQIRPTDMVILSAHPIPGNEKPVARVINQLSTAAGPTSSTASWARCTSPATPARRRSSSCTRWSSRSISCPSTASIRSCGSTRSWPRRWAPGRKTSSSRRSARSSR